MASKELITKIVLKGQTDPSLTKAFQNVSRMSDTGLNSLKKAGQFIGKAAKASAVAIGTGAVASTKAYIDWESAFAGVMKTVDETGTTTYENLSDGIRKMATELPASATEIAAVAESAGQLGIKADDILQFSRTMIDLGETTNLSSEEAASSIAKLFNITGTSMDNVDRFGATLVALGNNAATTEADIMNMASRIASSGNQIGLTESQTLALATSLSSVGLEAEGGGTAISTVMTKIDKAVALNGETLSTWADLAGMSVGEFKTAWDTDAYGALQKVVGGMGDATKGGENLNLILEELGIKGIRESDTMKRLASASELMGDMTNIASEAWKENTALTEEAGKRYATMQSKIDMLKNKFVEFGIQIGEKLAPYVEAFIDKLSSIDFDALADKIGNAIGWIAEHSTTLITIAGAIAGAFVGIKIAGLVKGIMTAVKIISILVKTFGFAKVAIAALGGPVTIVIGVIMALVGAFVALWHKSDAFRNFWIGLWNKIKSAASKAGEWLKNFFTVTIPNAFNTVINFIKSNWQGLLLMLVNPFAGAFKLLYDNCEGFRNVVNNVVTWVKNAFNSVVQWFVQLPSRIGTFISNVASKVATWGVNMWNKAQEIGRNFVNGVVKFFQQLPYKIGYVIGFVIGKVILFGQKLWTFATTTVPQFIGKVIEWFGKLPSRIWTWLVNAFNKVVAWGTNIINTGRAKASQFLTAVVNYVRQLPSRIWTFLSNAISRVISWGSNMVSQGRAKASQFISSVVSFISQLPSRIWTWFSNAISKVVSWGTQMVAKGRDAAQKLLTTIVSKISEIPGKLMSVGRNIVEGLWNGISGAAGWLAGKIKSFATGILDGMKSALGINSPSTKMRDLVGRFIPSGIAVGIQRNMGTAISAVKGMGAKITSTASKITPTISTKVATVGEKIKAFASGGTVTSPQHAIVGDAPETIVPHGNTPRNRSLLRDAARGVGANLGNKVFNITFAPVINGGNAESNRKMIEEEMQKFKQMMKEYFEEEERLAY